MTNTLLTNTQDTIYPKPLAGPEYGFESRFYGTCRGSIKHDLGTHIWHPPQIFFAGAEEREPGIEIGLGLSDLFVLSVNLVALFFDRSLSNPVTWNSLSNLRLLLVIEVIFQFLAPHV